MKHTLRLIPLFLLTLAACGSGTSRPAQTTVAEQPADTLASRRELPLPSIPAILRTVPARAAHVLEHFWDGLDFRDTLRSRDRAFMEQNFANFLSLFPHADTASLRPSVHRLLTRAEADTAAWQLVTEVAEKYLYEAASPMYNEGYFMFFLEEILRSPLPDAYEKVRPAYLLEAAKKNRPGMQAADFTYVTREGGRQTLHGMRGEQLLLIFYTPDCEHCRKTMVMLHKDPRVRRRIEAGELTVLAVYVNGDRALWNRTKGGLPADWIVGFEEGAIDEQELYALPALPSLYLLDGERRVLLKDASLLQFFDWLKQQE